MHNKFLLASLAVMAAICLAIARPYLSPSAGFQGSTPPPASAHSSTGGMIDIVSHPSDRISVSDNPPLAVATIESEEDSPEMVALKLAKADLADQVDMSLDGILEINRLLDKLSLIADLPISRQVDYEFDDSDAVAYKMLGTPEGMSAHFLVGLDSFERDGKTYKAYELEVQMDGYDVTFDRGAMRSGPRVRIMMDFDEDGNPGMLALLMTRRVALAASRGAGVDAYTGDFVTGCSYKSSMTNPEDSMSETYGIQNGHIVTSMTSPAYSNMIKPLAGDVILQPDKAQALLGKLHNHFAILKEGN